MIRFCLIGVVLGLCSVAIPAGAGSTTAPTKNMALEQRPCADDLAQLCKTVPRGAGRKFSCLDAHKSKLRPACRAFVESLDVRYLQMAAERHETVAKFLAEAYARYNTGVMVRPGQKIKLKQPQ